MKSIKLAAKLLILGVCGALLTGCPGDTGPVSSSGVKKATVKVETGADDLTTEQRNIKDRLILDNKVGSIKHLYVISPYSGDVILYSTVKGKVTSSGKRLSPKTIVGTSDSSYGFAVDVGGRVVYTHEILEDDGSYGSSVEYIYWWDQRGVYHQHFFTGGQILHVSDQPIRTGKVILNLETTQLPAATQSPGK